MIKSYKVKYTTTFAGTLKNALIDIEVMTTSTAKSIYIDMQNAINEKLKIDPNEINIEEIYKLN